MRVLNLYAGLGGNRKLWEGCSVTAVEMDTVIAKQYMDFFPNDEMVIGDAHDYLIRSYKDFDFIWSSPPCQAESRMVKYTRHDVVRYPDLSLYQEVIFLKEFFKGKWVVENVDPYYEPLIKAQQCGRHLFWSNFYIRPISIAAPESIWHGAKPITRKRLSEWLDIFPKKNIYYKDNHDPNQVLRNCVHPQLGLHVFNAAKDPTHLDLFSG